jgi:hypothetical protein
MYSTSIPYKPRLKHEFMLDTLAQRQHSRITSMTVTGKTTPRNILKSISTAAQLFSNVEHVCDYYWVFGATENESIVNRFVFHK